jgi:hypothetical protein
VFVPLEYCFVAPCGYFGELSLGGWAFIPMAIAIKTVAVSKNFFINVVVLLLIMNICVQSQGR